MIPRSTSTTDSRLSSRDGGPSVPNASATHHSISMERARRQASLCAEQVRTRACELYALLRTKLHSHCIIAIVTSVVVIIESNFLLANRDARLLEGHLSSHFSAQRKHHRAFERPSGLTPPPPPKRLRCNDFNLDAPFEHPPLSSKYVRFLFFSYSFIRALRPSASEIFEQEGAIIHQHPFAFMYVYDFLCLVHVLDSRV